MRRRVAGGIAGWLLGIVPLLGVNLVAGYLASSDNALYASDAALAGMVALVVGLVLGGIVAGALGGRRGGGTGALSAGGLAALLYAVSLLGLLAYTRTTGEAPDIIDEHPIRAGVVIVFLAALLMAIAYGVGLFAGRGAADEEPESAEQPALAGYSPYPDYPLERPLPPRSGPRQPPYPQYQQRPPYDQYEQPYDYDPRDPHDPRDQGSGRATRPLSDYELGLPPLATEERAAYRPTPPAPSVPPVPPVPPAYPSRPSRPSRPLGNEPYVPQGPQAPYPPRPRQPDPSYYEYERQPNRPHPPAYPGGDRRQPSWDDDAPPSERDDRWRQR